MEALDPTEWPRWFHHAVLESVLCATPAEVEDLPEGFRKEPWSEDEKYAYARAEERGARAEHQQHVERLEAVLSTPVDAMPPPPKPKVPYRRPSRAKAAMEKRGYQPQPRKKRGGGVDYADG